MNVRMATGLGICLTAALLAGGGEGAFQVERVATDGGGAMRSSGGGFALSATIGQPDAGVLSGASFTISGGVWMQSPPGDCNETGWPDLFDFEAFDACVSGPAGPVADAGCACFDVDASDSVDLLDFGALQRGF